MAYNLNWTNNTVTFVDLVDNINQAVNGGLIAVLTLVIFVLLFMVMKTRFDTRVAFFNSSWITSILVALFFFMGWVGSVYIITLGVVLIVSIIYMIWGG